MENEIRSFETFKEFLSQQSAAGLKEAFSNGDVAVEGVAPKVADTQVQAQETKPTAKKLKN